ncbi:ATP-binding cassette subfamily B multidrug efflux pump [Dysgonomonadaceae bacterium PH5-43]|nr:ATP-binding cassette subfamily B multidrug efflux pump [Dysgonomonadaceae bacterium PH5-43]
MLLNRFIKPFWVSILIIIVLTLGQVIADLLLPNFMADIVDNGIVQGDTSFILNTGVRMLAVAFAGIFCAISAGFFASRVALSVGRNMREAVFKHTSGFSLAEFDQIGTSSLITRTTNDVQQIQQVTFMVLRMMMRAPIMCLGGVVMAVQKDGNLSLLLLAILPFIAVIIYLIMVKAMPLFRTVQIKIDQLNLVIRETLIGIRIIRAFSRIGFYKKKFASANKDLTDTSIKANRTMAILNPSMNLCMNLLTIAIVFFASLRIDKGDLMVGDTMAFIQYATQIFMSLTMMTMMFVMLPRAFASGERIREVLNLHSDIVDAKYPQEPDIEQQGATIEFSNVSFRFNNAENCAIQNVSFCAKPGETLAIIGGTGAGKSSLLNLIPRYYDVESGSITINGIDIRNVKQYYLRELIGMVPQKITVFSGTINENIRMGKRNATKEQIEEACKIAQADEFINHLPEKYNTEIAQGGTNLSGGQKQRLSIARAIVKKPMIYLFDDSFSALDFKTDAKVREALAKETKHSTVIIVAQRISSIMNADKILVMDNGKIVGEGTHRELLKTNEVYQEIAASQLSEKELM